MSNHSAQLGKNIRAGTALWVKDSVMTKSRIKLNLHSNVATRNQSQITELICKEVTTRLFDELDWSIFVNQFDTLLHPLEEQLRDECNH